MSKHKNRLKFILITPAQVKLDIDRAGGSLRAVSQATLEFQKRYSAELAIAYNLLLEKCGDEDLQVHALWYAYQASLAEIYRITHPDSPWKIQQSGQGYTITGEASKLLEGRCLIQVAEDAFDVIGPSGGKPRKLSEFTPIKVRGFDEVVRWELEYTGPRGAPCKYVIWND